MSHELPSLVLMAVVIPAEVWTFIIVLGLVIGLFKRDRGE